MKRTAATAFETNMPSSPAKTSIINDLAIETAFGFNMNRLMSVGCAEENQRGFEDSMMKLIQRILPLPKDRNSDALNRLAGILTNPKTGVQKGRNTFQDHLERSRNFHIVFDLLTKSEFDNNSGNWLRLLSVVVFYTRELMGHTEFGKQYLKKFGIDEQVLRYFFAISIIQ